MKDFKNLSVVTSRNCPDINILGTWDFPGGPVLKNLPSNAGDAGSIPGWGTKSPHAVGQLRPEPLN